MIRKIKKSLEEKKYRREAQANLSKFFDNPQNYEILLNGETKKGTIREIGTTNLLEEEKKYGLCSARK